MRKIFQYILMTLALVATASCSNELDEVLQPAGNGSLQFVVSDFPAFGEGPDTRVIGTQDIGKTAWEEGDKLLLSISFESGKKQGYTLEYLSGVWTLNDKVLASSDITGVLALYAPDCEIKSDGSIGLASGKLYGMAEYITAKTSVDGLNVSISFKDVTRTYSRLRLASEAGQELTVTTTGFTPAGATEVATAAYTLTTDNNGNAFLYGVFAEGATVSVKQGDVTFASYTFTADKNPGGTEHNKSYALDARPVIDLSQYSEGETVEISSNGRIIGNGNEYNLTLNVAADATVIFEVGTGGVKLTAPITVADGKTMTLLVTGDAEHTVNGGISLGNASNVVIEGDLTKENNKLTVTATGSNAGIGANNGVTAGDITIRNARVEATGSGSADSPKVAGAGIGTAKASMGNILIVNSIVTAAGGYYNEYEAHGAAIGMGSDGVSMGNITLIDSEITASHSGEGHASIIGAGPDFAEGDRDGSDIGTMGDIIITNTDLHLSMAESTTDEYAAMIGTADFSGGGLSYSVNMGKIIFTDITQAELDEMIATWYIPSDFDEYGGYVLGLGYWSHVYKYNEYEAHCVGTFGGVWVSDGNGGVVQIGDADGYINPE